MTHPGRAPRLLFRLCLPLALVCGADWAAALTLDWPAGAERIAQDQSNVTGYRIATGPHDGTQVPTSQASGTLVEEIWTIPGEMGDPALLARLLAEELTAQGYEMGFACSDTACGGFDFRFALPIAEGPRMHVDLGQFQYLTATREGSDGTEHLALTLSHGGQLGYVHLARIAPEGSLPAQITPSTRETPQEVLPDGDLVATLTRTGYAVLADVSFATGAAALAEGRYDSLVALAAYLAEDPARRIVLVGHTDAEGAREANIALSRSRAGAVRQYLVETLGADPARVEAEGVGYLAPRASNSTAAGREANRRVEVVLIAQ
jgi:OOP family OmpA-OmpF porin